MPTYEYVCTDCGNNLEVVQRFTDESLTECPVCHGRLRKMFYPVGVVFKGSGFYRTDSRTQDKERAAAGSTNGSPDTKADDAVNYGGIGAVIGHEIGHGFDDQGSTCDGDGMLRNWWTEKDREAFEERTRALIDQYNALQPVQDRKSVV